jgi:hypothetical protein
LKSAAVKVTASTTWRLPSVVNVTSITCWLFGGRAVVSAYRTTTPEASPVFGSVVGVTDVGVTLAPSSFRVTGLVSSTEKNSGLVIVAVTIAGVEDTVV